MSELIEVGSSEFVVKMEVERRGPEVNRHGYAEKQTLMEFELLADPKQAIAVFRQALASLTTGVALEGVSARAT